MKRQCSAYSAAMNTSNNVIFSRKLSTHSSDACYFFLFTFYNAPTICVDQDCGLLPPPPCPPLHQMSIRFPTCPLKTLHQILRLPRIIRIRSQRIANARRRTCRLRLQHNLHLTPDPTRNPLHLLRRPLPTPRRHALSSINIALARP